MPTHNKKHDETVEDVAVVAVPKRLLALLIPDPKENKWATDQLTNEGPLHKQVLSALLLNRLDKLVQTIEKSTGTSFTLQSGYNLTKEKDGVEKVLPVAIPINLGSGIDKNMVGEAISHAPEHEELAYAICLQVVDWAIKASTKHRS